MRGGFSLTGRPEGGREGVLNGGKAGCFGFEFEARGFLWPLLLLGGVAVAAVATVDILFFIAVYQKVKEISLEFSKKI